MPESNLTNQYSPSPYVEEDELSLIDLWNIVWKRKVWWLTLGPFAGIIGIVVALTSTEIYRAEVLMSPTRSEESGGGLAALAGQFGGLASMAGINLGGGGGTATAIATLKSRRFINAFIEERDLLPILFEDQWNAETNEWITEDSQEPPTAWKAYKAFSGILGINEDKKTGLITLAIEWKDPKLASIWINEIAVLINSHLRTKAKTETEQNLVYLKKQLQETQLIEIKESLYSLIQSQTQNAMLANANQEYAFKIIDPAVVPEERVSPKRTLIVLIYGMLGGFLGIFLCFVFHFIETAKREQIKD